MKTKRMWRLLGAVILICGAAGLAWTYGFSQEAAKPDPAAVEAPGEPGKPVDVIRPRAFTETLVTTLPGRARARHQATLFFRVSGPLHKVHVEPGDRVTKGQVMLELDDRDYLRQVQVVESRIKSARANLAKLKKGARAEDIQIIQSNLKAARSDLDLAKKDLNRYQVLYKNHAASEQSYDRAKNSVNSLRARTAALEKQLARDRSGARKEDILAARAGIEELEVQLAIARDRLSDTKLTAPFDGVVTARMAEAFEMVVQGAPVLTLDDTRSLEIPVHVPENTVPLLLDASRSKGNRYAARFLTTGDKEFKAGLAEYSSRADAATGTFEFVFSVTPAPDDLVFPGMTAEISIYNPDTAAASLVIPLKSLMQIQGNRARVYVVDPDTHRAGLQEIAFDSLIGTDQVKVTQGLSSQDIIVSKGSAFIRPGQALAIETVQ